MADTVEIENRIKELFDRYYSQYYDLINIEINNSIRNSKFIYKCKNCNQLITKEGKYLYQAKHLPKHKCFLNLEYNFKVTKEEINNRLKYLKENYGKDFKLIDFTKEWFLKNFKTRSKTKITLQCNKHPDYITKTTINNFLNDSGFFGCKICSSEKMQDKYKMNIDKIKENLNKLPAHFKYPNNYWFKNNYKNSKTKFSVYCTKHFYLNKNININRIFNNNNPCPFCSGHLINYEDFIIRSKKIHFDQYKYLISKYEWYNTYTNYKDFKIKIYCKTCKSFFDQKIINHLDGYGCPFCSASKGERKIQYYLENNNIDFEYQKIIKKDKKINFIFDFFIPKYNLAIEYDGEQHFKSINFYGGEKGFQKRQDKDKDKDQYCKDNNINLLRIPYYKYDNIENILEKNLDF